MRGALCRGLGAWLARCGGQGLPPPTSVAATNSTREDVSLRAKIRDPFARQLWTVTVHRELVVIEECISDCSALKIGCSERITLIGLQCFLDFYNCFNLRSNWGCIRWSSATACTPLSVLWRKELERWAYFFCESEHSIYSGLAKQSRSHITRQYIWCALL